MIRGGLSPLGMGTLRALRPVSVSLPSAAASQAAQSQVQPNGAGVKRARKAKAAQAQKLRNSAKGKVPKSALGECG